MSDLLFRPFKLKNMELRNRFVMSAAADNPESQTEARIARFSELAKRKIMNKSIVVRLSSLTVFLDIFV